MILRNLKDVSWAGAKSMMADPYFLKSLVDFDKDGLTDKQVGRQGMCLICHPADKTFIQHLCMVGRTAAHVWLTFKQDAC